MEFTEFYLAVAGAATALLIAYIALLHMAARFLGKPETAAYANVELQQLFISVIIFVAAFGALQFADMASSSMGITKPGETTIDASIGFLQLVIQQGVTPAYIDLVSLDVKLSFWNALQGRHGPTVWNFIFKQVIGLEPVISVVRILTFTLTAFLGTLCAQVIIFYLITALGPIILASGVLVRFFPSTRDAGVYLIIFAIAFLTFFPFLFALNAHILEEMSQAHYGESYDPYISMPHDMFVADLAWSPRWIAQLFSFFPFVSFFSFIALSPFFEGIASLSLPALILPAISMSMTISFINAVTKFVTGKG